MRLNIFVACIDRTCVDFVYYNQHREHTHLVQLKSFNFSRAPFELDTLRERVLWQPAMVDSTFIRSLVHLVRVDCLIRVFS